MSPSVNSTRLLPGANRTTRSGRSRVSRPSRIPLASSSMLTEPSGARSRGGGCPARQYRSVRLAGSMIAAAAVASGSLIVLQMN